MKGLIWLNILIMILFIALASLIYSVCRILINKKYNLHIPIIPERYYDNMQITIIQAILTIFSLLSSLFILNLIFGEPDYWGTYLFN